MPLTRTYEVQYLTSNDDVNQFRRVAPATPVFEEAFSAFARGALISTASGLRAVEDLMPGDLVETSDAGPQPLLWVGSMTLYPDMTSRVGAGAGQREPDQMFRITADAFGYDRPAPDLMLGPRARLLYRHSGCRSILNAEAGFAPLRAFCDGTSVIGISPVSPQQVYHLAFARQHCVSANGLEVESFHPGDQPEAMMARDMQRLFLDLFPHLEGFEGFGPMLFPRLTAFELESLRAA
ncbi:Hint domain-containing protein [Alphaproteobacteria bacterium KMM 3653]|uniref:Hint domain-containing protein n=1 Tax=Harenicola maris TaxID=2841044 RepID=A0AAP2CQR5_9RHOB|nr:Hint domain-containing protein [Harenicola maris]